MIKPGLTVQAICTDPGLRLRDPAPLCGLTAIFKRLLHTYRAQCGKIERVWLVLGNIS